MAPETRSYRLAIAILSETDALSPTILELVEIGFSHDQLNVAALAPTWSRIATSPRPAEPGQEHLVLLVARLQPLRLGGHPLLVTPGPLCEAIKQETGGQASNPELVAWMSPTLRIDLIQHIRDGAVILCANAASVQQQLSSTRTLLRHTSHRVQTHEFTITR